MKNKLLIITIILLLSLGTIYKINYDNQEKENLKIDEYNFTQLEKVKKIFENSYFNAKQFYTLKEFNKIYKTDIKPIKNCYILSNTENFFGQSGYTFMTKIYSNKFKNKYNHEYYIYPENTYNSIEKSLCGPHGGTCTADLVFSEYIKIITNPCRD
ncbi:MAG: hypothetical protein PHR68_03080 [Candidatus Gracilibacteria bacterium]|nr:hypothetical protein [Candidatus Gracilibacteria bacterium]